MMENFPQQITEEDGGKGLVPDPDIRKVGVAVTVDYVDNVKKGKIQIKPGVASSEGRKVTFADGSSEEFDAVICATGYETNLSFLPQRVQDKVCYRSPFKGGKEVALYKHTLVPGMENLAFAGIVDNVGPHHAIGEMQARYIAATFSGKVPRPSDDQLQGGVEAFKRYREQGERLHAVDLMPLVCEDIGDELGVTPSYLEGIWNVKKLLLSPLYNCYYRTNPKVEGEEKAKKFQKRFDEFVATPTLA
jgi:hypothetical protein